MFLQWTDRGRVNRLYSSVAEYIEFSNSKRPYQKFGYRTQKQVEGDYFTTIEIASEIGISVKMCPIYYRQSNFISKIR